MIPLFIPPEHIDGPCRRLIFHVQRYHFRLQQSSARLQVCIPSQHNRLKHPRRAALSIPTLTMSTFTIYLLLLLPFSTIALPSAVMPAHAAAAVPILVNISFPTAEPRAGQPVSPTSSFKRSPDQQPIPTTAFLKSHEQLLHMVGVGEDLDTFFHWHPSTTYRQAFSLQKVVFPKAGTYLVALDGLIAEGPLASSTKIRVGGSPRMIPAASTTTAAAAGSSTVVTVKSIPLQKQQSAVSLKFLIVPTGSSAVAEERGSSSSVYTLTLAGPYGSACKPGATATYTWTLSHGGKTSSSASQPVKDLVLYYGAPMHLAVVKSDLSVIRHVHGDIALPVGTTNASTVGTAPLQYPVIVDTTYRPSGVSQAAPAGNLGAYADMGEHAGHGHGRRRLLQSSRDRSGNSLTQLLDRIGNALDDRLYEAGIIEPRRTAMPSQGSAQHASHSGHTGAVGVTSFGPALRTQVVFPTAGRYLLVGQVSRRNELILLPVFVSCTGR